MSFVLIAICVLIGLALFGQSKSEEEKITASEEPKEAFEHGYRAMFFTVVAGLFIIFALLALGIAMTPHG